MVTIQSVMIYYNVVKYICVSTKTQDIWKLPMIFGMLTLSITQTVVRIIQFLTIRTQNVRSMRFIENTVDVPGIQKIYQLRATKKSCEGGRNTIYVRKVMCMCKFCVHSIYDRCLITDPW